MGKTSSSSNPLFLLFTRLFSLVALTLATLPLWLPLQAVLKIHLSLPAFALFFLSAGRGICGNFTLRSKGTTLLVGFVVTYLFAGQLPVLPSGHPFGVTVTAYLTVFLAFGYLALFWWVAHRFLLKPCSLYPAPAAPSLHSKSGMGEGNP